jgi:hypothetical protein
MEVEILRAAQEIVKKHGVDGRRHDGFVFAPACRTFRSQHQAW